MRAERAYTGLPPPEEDTARAECLQEGSAAPDLANHGRFMV